MAIVPRDVFSQLKVLMIDLGELPSRHNATLGETILRIALTMDNLEELQIRYPLAYVTDILRSKHDGQLVLPHLTRLGLNYSKITEGSDEDIDADMLCSCLEERRALGFGIVELDLEGCKLNVSDQFYDRLKAMGIQLVFDEPRWPYTETVTVYAT